MMYFSISVLKTSESTEIMAKATSDSVMALSIVSVVLMSLCISVQAKDNFALWVNRRNTNDLYRANSTADTWICYDNYMIHERRCVSDEELLHGISI